MKKTYISPAQNVVELDTETLIAESQGGIASGCSLGDDYDSNDQNYVKEFSSSSLWDSKW